MYKVVPGNLEPSSSLLLIITKRAGMPVYEVNDEAEEIPANSECYMEYTVIAVGMKSRAGVGFLFARVS
ncbi:hypothetical protein AYI69_g5022 [Smittium culicis]|uniref:Uncharacterized protein n=1 Tax=Smittium culicis TaxID=133412 RepID=A0A1R1Y942_9FUNG|nr:hypothetical protein AYI69_g5022 [Smittium culicis]